MPARRKIAEPAEPFYRPVKDQVKELMEALPSKISIRGTNAGASLAAILLWQEVERIAGEEMEAAYKDATMLPDDATLREQGEGDHIPYTAGNFILTTKVSKPGARFDKDQFINELANDPACKLGREALMKMALKCTKETKAPLKKRVLERET